AVDKLQDQERLTGRRNTRIDEPGDVRVSDPREKIAFAPETLLACPAHERGMQQLDGNLALVAAVAAAGEPHAAHAALPEWRLQRIRADRLTGQSGPLRVQRRGPILEKALTVEGACVLEQRVDLSRERGILLPQRREPSDSLVDGHLQNAIEQRTDSPPAVVVDGHRTPSFVC